MSDENTLPNDQDPIDDLPTEVHDDWAAGDKPDHEPEPPTVKTTPSADELDALDDLPEPVAEELPEPVAEAETLEGDDWLGEEEEISPFSGINTRMVLLGVGGGLVLLTALVLAALFLPPFYLAATLRGCQAIDANNPSLLRDDGLTANWIGPDAVRLCVNSYNEQDLADGKGGAEMAGALDGLPPYLHIMSPIYTIEKIGDSDASLEITLPGGSTSNLDLYRWDSKTTSWVFVPSHVDAAAGLIITDEAPTNVVLVESDAITPLIGSGLNTGDVFDPNVGTAMNIITPTGITLGPDNTLGGAVAGGWQLGQGYAVVPVVKGSDTASLSALLNSEADLALHVDDLKAFVVGDGYNGVVIDYDAVSMADAEAFTGFITKLADELHKYDKRLIVRLPAPTGIPGGYDTGGYDWRAIGAAADAVIISPGNNPDDYAVNGNATTLVSWATGEVSRYKVYLAFPIRSAQSVGGAISLISYDEALDPLGKTALATQLEEGKDSFAPGSSVSVGLDGSVTDVAADQNTGALRYTVGGDAGQRQVWIVTSATIRARLDMASAQHIGGIIMEGLMSPGNDGGLPTVINEFKASQASTVPSGLNIKWTVTSASGAVSDNVTGLGTQLAWQAGDAGDYKISAEIVGGKAVNRGEVALKVGAVATTAAATPTKAPVGPVVTSVPGATTPAPTTAAPPPPPPVASGGAGGPTELGGQVPGHISHASQMQQAGMKWVKFQAPYGSVDAAGAAGYVAAGHAAGFKVLLSMPGPHYPTSVDYGGFISHVGAVAASQPDAIEVWNEMNIINEWPEGQIDPNAYVSQMLAPAFNAIKTASPNTMVIIGALAPTGFDDNVHAWSDARYSAGLAAAGAGQYADCMGVHHNSGTTPPDVQSGRPEGDHYSWYFLPTIYVNHTAAPNLPICLTEFGYLSPDGYGGLPANFAWGANTSVDEQAAWLAQGYSIAKGLGYARLVIVWNVDFTMYGADPQAGFAIVRPDGSCPACATLGAVAN